MLKAWSIQEWPEAPVNELELAQIWRAIAENIGLLLSLQRDTICPLN